MADVKPIQASFSQPFGPRYDNIYKGSLMRNLYTESHADGPYAVKRSGLLLLGQPPTIGFIEGLVMGIVAWDIRAGLTDPSVDWPKYTWTFVRQLSTGNYYYITYNSLLAPGSQIIENFFWASSEPLGNCLYWVPLNLVGQPPNPPLTNFVMQSGADIFTVVVVEGPPLQFVATRVTQTISQMMPGIAFLDGTVYVISQTDNLIHGSAIQDPTTWNGLNVIGASTSWGKAVAISRHLNYILGFYEFGIQVYYDAGLAPPASPLSPLPNASFLIGLAGQSSVVSLADTTFFIGKSAAGNLSVYQLSGLSLSIISTPMVDAILQQHSAEIRTDFGADGIANAYPWNDKGTNFYCLNFWQAGALDPTEPSYTIAYNLSTQEWVVFTQNISQGGGAAIESAMAVDWNSGNFVAGVLDNVGTGTTNLFLGGVSPTTYQDYGLSIDCMVLTAPQNFQSSYKKFISRMTVYADTIADTMQVRYTDDDYNTYSGYYTIDLSKQRKKVERLGSFYERSFEFTYSGNFPFRARMYELMIVGGSQ